MMNRYTEKNSVIKAVKPSGMLADRIELSLSKLLRDSEPLCKYMGWGADQIGRWIGATCVLAELTGKDIADTVKARVEELIGSQEDAGLFYGDKLVASYDPKQASNIRKVWFGHGRAIRNLIDYYELTKDKAALDAAVKGADCALAGQREWEISNPICAGIESVISGMVKLTELTGQNKYIKYARWVAENIDTQTALPSDRCWSHRPLEELQHTDIPHGHHTHSYLSITHGIVDLAMTAGEEKYLERAERVFNDTLKSMWLTGNIPENYGELYEYNDEICSVVDWIMLGLKLFQAAGKAKYLDIVEHSFLNQILFGQDYEGGFTADRSFNRRHWVDEKNHGCVADGCCTMHGGWLLAQIAKAIFTISQNGLSINFPLETDAKIKISGSPVKLSQRVNIEAGQIVQKTEMVNTGGGLIARLRLPYWCDSPRLSVNGQAVTVNSENGFAKIHCKSNATTTIELCLPMKLEVVPSGRTIFNKGAKPAPGTGPEQGLQYGPFVLMFNREMYKGITEKDIAVKVKLDNDGNPVVSRQIPQEWPNREAILLFIEAQINGKQIFLTPCANMTMTRFTVSDPYVLRFSDIRFG